MSKRLWNRFLSINEKLNILYVIKILFQAINQTILKFDYEMISTISIDYLICKILIN